MSVMEEDIITAPWVGPTCFKKCLSIAVLSTNVDIINNISDALNEVHSKGSYRWKLVLLRAQNLEEVVKHSQATGSVGMDFVVVALDTNRVVCVEWARHMLAQIHPDLRRRRVVLVNASGLPGYSMAVNAEELLQLQDELKLEQMSSNVFNADDAACLARRLLKYLEVSVGTATGIPNLNI